MVKKLLGKNILNSDGNITPVSGLRIVSNSSCSFSGQDEDKFLLDLENLTSLEHESSHFKHTHLSFLQEFDLEMPVKDWSLSSSSNRTEKFVRFRNEVVDGNVPAFYRAKWFFCFCFYEARNKFYCELIHSWFDRFI